MVVVYHNLQHSLRLGDFLERVLHNCVFWLYVSSHPEMGSGSGEDSIALF